MSAAYASLGATGPGAFKSQLLDALAMGAADVGAATATKEGQVKIRSVRSVPGALPSPRRGPARSPPPNLREDSHN